VRVDWAGVFDLNGGRDMSVTTALANMYFDIPMDTAFTPYVGAGAGYGWGSVGNGNDKDGLAYALMAGAEINMSENMSLDVGYRFRSIVSDGANPMEHQVLVGVRYGF
jgi:opacity protein-like surface antigen